MKKKAGKNLKDELIFFKNNEVKAGFLEVIENSIR